MTVLEAFYMTWPLWAFIAVLTVSLYVAEAIDKRD
jgi:hypothetical protein